MCIIKLSVYVTKQSEYRVEYKMFGFSQNVCAFGKTSKRERLGFCGFVSVEYVHKGKRFL